MRARRAMCILAAQQNSRAVSQPIYLIVRTLLLLSLVLLGSCAADTVKESAAEWPVSLALDRPPNFTIGSPETENPGEIYSHLFGAGLLDESIVYGNEAGELVRVSFEGTEIWRALGLGDGPEEVDAGLNPTVHSGLITATAGRATLAVVGFDGTVRSVQKGVPDWLTSSRLYPRSVAPASDGSLYYIATPSGPPVEDPQSLVHQVGDSAEIVKEFAPVEITEQPPPGTRGSWSWTGVHVVKARDETLILYRATGDRLEMTNLNLNPISEIQAEDTFGNALLDQCGRIWITIGQMPERRLHVYSSTGERLFEVSAPANTGSPLDATRGRVLFAISDPDYDHSYMGVWVDEEFNRGCGTD